MQLLLRLLYVLPLLVIAWKIRRMVSRFREVGATSPATSRSLANLGLDPSHILRRLERRGIVRELPDERYYLDESAYERWTQRRRLILAVILSIMALVALVPALTQ